MEKVKIDEKKLIQLVFIKFMQANTVVNCIQYIRTFWSKEDGLRIWKL